MLYPKDNAYRTTKDISGIWEFLKDPEKKGEALKWYAELPSGVIPMPVPASYNDITQDRELREYVGDVWYFTKFNISPELKGKHISREEFEKEVA